MLSIQQAVVAVSLVSILSACSFFDEAERQERRTANVEKREHWAYQQQRCEQSKTGAWMCSGSNKRAQEQQPWLYCGCVDNQRVLE